MTTAAAVLHSGQIRADECSKHKNLAKRRELAQRYSFGTNRKAGAVLICGTDVLQTIVGSVLTLEFANLLIMRCCLSQALKDLPN